MEVSSIKAEGNSPQKKLLAKFRRRAERLARRVGQVVDAYEQAQEEIRQLKRQLDSKLLEVANYQTQILALDSKEHSGRLVPFSDTNILQHRFAASMVALCVNLSNIMPFRTVAKTLPIVLSAIGIQTPIPDRETITRWCKRIGLDRLRENQELATIQQDMIWIVDHSNQIGTQKVLVILGVAAHKLPREGQTLQLDNLHVLAIEPGVSWTRDDVRRVYKELADLIGRPRWVLCDGAVELRESADVLCDEHHTTRTLRDFKHVAANRFESLIGKSDRFSEFVAQMGKTRCLIQQTELAHLTPPGMKTKARFMNIEPMIAWAAMVLGVLACPEAPESGVKDPKKLEQRLGWLREFADAIASWQRCCAVISWSLAWVNSHSLKSNTAEEMRKGLESLQGCDLSTKMTEELLKAVEQSCANVQPGEQSWLSSECLESAFALFKKREGQQSRSGFTGLILTLPSLLRQWTSDEVRKALMRTSTKDANQWIEKNIGETIWAKRTRAFNHFTPNI